jgi:hypothetical protein
MDYPTIFPVRTPFAGRSADAVRQIAANHGFRQHEIPRSTTLENARMRGFSEIWFKLAGHGYAIIRIDTQGHANLQSRDGTPTAIGGISPGPHGAVPHYHKEWVAAEYLERYLTAYVPQVVRYDDAGDPVTGFMTDGKAKATHIKQ